MVLLLAEKSALARVQEIRQLDYPNVRVVTRVLKQYADDSLIVVAVDPSYARKFDRPCTSSRNSLSPLLTGLSLVKYAAFGVKCFKFFSSFVHLGSYARQSARVLILAPALHRTPLRRCVLRLLLEVLRFRFFNLGRGVFQQFDRQMFCSWLHFENRYSFFDSRFFLLALRVSLRVRIYSPRKLGS